MHDFEVTGYWFLPGDPDKEIAGTLRFSKVDGLELALNDSLGESLLQSTAQKYPVIHGVTNENPYGTMFTLVDCFRSGASLHMPGFATETIHANSAYVGGHLLQEADLRFDEFQVSFSDLPNWTRLAGIQQPQWTVRDDGIRDLHFDHRAPGEIRVAFAGKPLALEFRREFHCTKRSLTLREHVAFRISDLERLPIDQIHRKYLHPLHNFFTFAADHPNAIDRLVVLTERIRFRQADRPSAIHVLMQPQYVRPGGEKPRDADDMLFTYEDVSESFGELLNRWAAFCERFAPFCRVYFSSLYCPGDFVEERFLSAVRALILLFQDSTPERFTNRPKIDALKNCFSVASPDQQARWWASTLPIDAELRFPWDLLDTLNEYQDLVGPVIGGDAEHFVDAVVVTRRYAQWCEPSLRLTSLRGMDLHWMTEKLKVLLKVCVLDRLAFPRDLIAALLNRNPRYHHLKSVS